MPAPDDAVVATLSRLAAAAPPIDVDTSRVVPTARRRRDRRRSVATASLGLMVLAGVGISQASAWTADPVVSAQETLGRSGRVAGAPEQSPAIAPLSVDPATTDDTSTDTSTAGLPTALVVGLGAAGVGGLGAGAFFAARSRRHVD